MGVLVLQPQGWAARPSLQSQGWAALMLLTRASATVIICLSSLCCCVMLPPGPFDLPLTCRRPAAPPACREIGFIVYAIGKPLDPFLQKQY